MRWPVRTPIAMALVLGLAACGGGNSSPEEGAGEAEIIEAPAAAEAPDAEETVSGEAVFSTNCATCHGATGDGNGPAAVGLEPPPADMTDAEWTTGDGSLDAIRNTIENGSPGTAMIAWEGTLSDEQIQAVAEYVRGLAAGSGE